MKDDTTLINEVLERIPNKYLAVVVATKRARAINDGASLLIKTNAKKPSTMALEEIAAGAYTLEMAKLGIGTPEKKVKEPEKMLPPPDESTDIEDEE